MNWEQLLSASRIGQAAHPEPSVRSDYQRDGDRILFSAAFRRMQDKTQVFPLEKNDYVRTRLTHSLEVSCVGRSLGSSAGQTLIGKYPALKTQGIQAADIGDIVAAACLAHDLGNPPFGHSGEQALRDFFTGSTGQAVLDDLQLTPAEQADMRNIEGNAQGFRITNRLESPDNKGGLRLTAATLAASAKYPATAAAGYYKKNGVYQDDLEDYAAVFEAVGVPKIAHNCWLRHPLSFLMEAADDICYLIADVEDAYQVGQISYAAAHEFLSELAGSLTDSARLGAMQSASDKLAYLRAKAIGRLVHETIDVFWQNEPALLAGSRKNALLADIPAAPTLKALREFSVTHIYNCRPVLEIQIAGHRVLNGLIEHFATALMSTRTHRQETILKLLPKRYQRHAHTPYQQLLAICDYITGMTDSYAVSLYKKLTGISLPVD